ncbi:MAG: hypothetical protein N2662_07320 [Bacteroidales bacterium]|nr:hypothetical protein [Bacteroidales bacterium]
MKILSLIIFSLVIGLNNIIAQNQSENLKKYWRYRERLRNKFIVIDQNVERYGVNIPATEIDYGANQIRWDDGNSGISHYLSVLATELWLLKNNNQDYSTTLKELYYAMLALERLDLYAEYSLRYRDNIGFWIGNTWIRGYIDPYYDINGFHLRDDVSDGFWRNYQNHFDVSDFGSVFDDNNMKENSQDNIFHHMEGLALVAKLVGSESVANIPVTFVNEIIPNRLRQIGVINGTTVNFSLWAKDIVKRYINYMQNDGRFEKCFSVACVSTHWFLKNPITNQLVQEGSGSDLDLAAFYHFGVVKTGQAITNENLQKYDGLEIPSILNLFLPSSEEIFIKLFRNHTVDVNIPNPLYPQPLLYYLIIEGIFGGIDVPINFDDYKVRTLACNGNVLGGETFSILRRHRDNYSPYVYEHLPLLYLVLHDFDYNVMKIEDEVYLADKTYYENLLNIAPTCGPTSDGVYEWSSTSRCVWPENLGKNSNQHIAYSGLDYMMLHNLYYIAFRKEDFKKTNITLPITTLIPLPVPITYWNGIIEADNTITNANVRYYASNRIILKPGFNVKLGATFEANIYKRPNNYAGSEFKYILTNQCQSSRKSKILNTHEISDTTMMFIEPPKIK